MEIMNETYMEILPLNAINYFNLNTRCQVPNCKNIIEPEVIFIGWKSIIVLGSQILLASSKVDWLQEID